MELALLRSRGPGLVPQLSYLHELRQAGFLSRHGAASCPPRRVQAQGSALPRHPRGRPARRGAVGDVDPAGSRPVRLGPVAPAGILAKPICFVGRATSVCTDGVSNMRSVPNDVLQPTPCGQAPGRFDTLIFAATERCKAGQCAPGAGTVDLPAAFGSSTILAPTSFNSL